MFQGICPYSIFYSKGTPESNGWQVMEELTPSKCTHIVGIQGVTFKDIIDKRKESCYKCNYKKNIRWLCLHPGCLTVGCGKKVSDHSTLHFQETGHAVHLSLSKYQVYCNLCQDQVQPDCNIPGWKLGEKLLSGVTLERLKAEMKPDASSSDPSENSQHGNISKSNLDPRLISVAPATPVGGEFQVPSPLLHRMVQAGFTASAKSDETPNARVPLLSGRPFRERECPKAVLELDDDDIDGENPPGLTGLKNLGNTCYMSAALQNLSNCPPLSEYFQAFPIDANPQPTALALAFKALIEQLWSPNRSGCIPPYKFLGQVRNAFPAFRGYSQQDSQEFLRCFLDQLHQEMKEPVVLDFTQEAEEEENGNHASGDSSSQRSGSSCSESNSSEPDLYETADSGCSSEQEGLRSPGRRKGGYRLRSQSDSFGESFEDANDSSQISPRKARSQTSTSSQQLSQGGGTKKKPIRYRSIITDIFDGKLASRVQCLTCNHISETKETFQDLSLPIPSAEQLESLRSKTTGGGSLNSVGDSGVYSSQESINTSSGGSRQGWLGWMWSGLTGIPMYMYDWWRGPDISLQDCLSAFFLPDDLRGDDMYSCEKCKKLRNGVKCCRLLSLPEVLCVHLKRFRHELMYSSKVSTRVRFPMDSLDLRPFADKKCAGEVSNYELTGIITHYGGAEGGHYVAYCRNPQNMKWYEFDDSFVTEVPPAQVLTSEAYVLFYQKVDKAIWKVREEAERLMAVSQQMRTRRAVKFYISQKWLKRLETFTEPGPITNSDFLCPHGGIDPRKVVDLTDRYAEIPDTVWKYLHSKFKGGPSCNTLVHCLICQQEVLRLERKRQEELKTYKMLEKEASDPGAPRDLHDFRLLSGRWFEQWDMFIAGSRGYASDVPGAIDNRPLLVDRHGKMYLRQHARWHRVSRDMWEYFYGVYGGGPEVYPTNAPQPTPEEIQAEAEARAEAHLRMEALAKEKLRQQQIREQQRQREQCEIEDEADEGRMDVDEKSSTQEEDTSEIDSMDQSERLPSTEMDSSEETQSEGVMTRSRSSLIVSQS